MATQLVQQRLHLVRQLRHIGKTKGGSTTFDRMGAAKNTVQLFIVGVAQIKVEQHLLHLIQIFASLLEENLVELAQVEIGACAFVGVVSHGGSCSSCGVLGCGVSVR